MKKRPLKTCRLHKEHDPHCYDCKAAERFTRMVERDREDYQCICPVLRPTPGGCPVHGG